MTVVEVLQKARGYVAAGWCQESLAKDRYGSPVVVTSEEVDRVCADGALLRVVGGESAHPLFQRARMQLQNAAGYTPISFWNDMHGRTQEEVLVVFDRAIAAAEAGG